jgi:hypothetical protein
MCAVNRNTSVICLLVAGVAKAELHRSRQGATRTLRCIAESVTKSARSDDRFVDAARLAGAQDEDRAERLVGDQRRYISFPAKTRRSRGASQMRVKPSCSQPMF